jgi:peroxiredoxin Q/BCP
LSDRKRVLIKALTGSGTSTARSHFIFEKGGKLIDKKQPVKATDRSVVRPSLSVSYLQGTVSAPLALEFIKGLNKDEPMTEDA